MVYIHSTGAPAKNAKECVVGHMSCDATQGCTFETTFRIGGLNGQRTSHSTSQQETFHWRFPIGYRHPSDRPECELQDHRVCPASAIEIAQPMRSTAEPMPDGRPSLPGPNFGPKSRGTGQARPVRDNAPKRVTAYEIGVLGSGDTRLR